GLNIMNYIKTTYLFAFLQFKRLLRDPLTLIILSGIPIVLLLVFGALMRSTDNLSLRTAVVNQSEHEFSEEFTRSLTDVSVLKIADDQLTLQEATEKMQSSELDTILVLPSEFGTPNEQ